MLAGFFGAHLPVEALNLNKRRKCGVSLPLFPFLKMYSQRRQWLIREWLKIVGWRE